MVKDPRAFWFHDLWRIGVHDHGAELTFLTMLRHPVEVVKSRDTTICRTGRRLQSARATANLAGWCQRGVRRRGATRAVLRTFVRYADLLADWRSAMAAQLEIGIA